MQQRRHEKQRFVCHSDPENDCFHDQVHLVLIRSPSHQAEFFSDIIHPGTDVHTRLTRITRSTDGTVGI